jgi:hypothetical protein
MNQISENTQGRKPKICKPAILSPLIIILGCLTGLIILISQGRILQEEVGVSFLFVSPVVGLILGIITSCKIHESNGALKGYVFSISGVVLAVGIIIFLFLLPRLTYPPRPADGMICVTNLAMLGKAIILYANNYDPITYPTKDKWCDLLVEYADVDEKTLVCKGALKIGDKGRCHYAMNPNCEPNSPNDVVLLFETSGGWNQYGGPELLNTEHHKGEGCSVLFNNGYVRFIKTKNIGELKWGNEPKDEPKQ